MIGRRFVIIVGVAAVWAMGPVTAAHAFEQVTPQAPPVPVTMSVAPVLSLDDEKVDEPKPEKKGRGLKLPGIGRLSIPKFNFGLDLMYGAPEASDTDLGFSSETTGEDVTIMGKVKRRF